MLLESRFRKLNRIYRSSMRDNLLSHGLYFGQPPILYALLDAGACTQKEISEKLSISQATVAVSIRRLLKGGFITKAADVKDLRRNRIELTQMGRQAAQACRADSDLLFTRMCRDLNTAEIRSLSEYFMLLSNNLQNME